MQAGQKVHKLCRKNYTRPTDIKSKDSETGEDLRESAEVTPSGEINLRNVCMFCLKPTKDNKKGIEWHQVKKESFENMIRQCIRERNDKLAQEVDVRIGNSNLVLIGATYHQPCSTKFRSFTSSESDKLGRPKDQNRDAAFLKICSYMMDNEGEAFAISDLCRRMEKECDENTQPYSRKYFNVKKVVINTELEILPRLKLLLFRRLLNLLQTMSITTLGLWMEKILSMEWV